MHAYELKLHLHTNCINSQQPNRNGKTFSSFCSLLAELNRPRDNVQFKLAFLSLKLFHALKSHYLLRETFHILSNM